LNRTIACTVNGKKKELTVDVRQSLLEVLREQLGLISIKQGCAAGECGACTVLIDDVPIDACIYLAVWADGRSIRTVEGESREGELSKVQQAFVDEGAVQCGFCTPGFVLAATAFVEKHSGQKITRNEIRRGLAGNLCRCTGYETIISAVEKSLALSGVSVSASSRRRPKKTD
jgi:aerobic-type carbon monoxide dehydrogenase small subunit (CoxS/CutS family)